LAPTPPSQGGGVDPATLDFLLSGRAFAGERPERRIDTHAAMIFLTKDHAWKLKRPVALGYLDFSTPAARHDALIAEDRLNRRTAPRLYQGVHAITRGDAGLALDGLGPAVDWLLEMTRFPDGALLSERATRGDLDPTILMTLAERIQRFHGMATIVLGPGAARRFAKVVAGNAEAAAHYPAYLDPMRSAALNTRLKALTEKLAPQLEARGLRGHVRRCHGDLHLANIAMLDGAPTPFDCLEFDEALATTDVLYDLAFLLMDLWARGLRCETNLVINRYLDLAAAEEDAFELLPLFMAVRAQIRAHVAAAQASLADQAGGHAEAGRYLALAEHLTDPVAPRLIAIGGLSGSGKSTIARCLGGFIGAAPGARILRSDVLRKHRAGVAPETRLDADAYTPSEAEAVYTALDGQAGRLLGEGASVIADAVFGDEAMRINIRAVAERKSATFIGFWLDASEAKCEARVSGRGPDASDATAAVLHQQSQVIVAPADWIRIDAGGAPDEVLADIRVRLG